MGTLSEEGLDACQTRLTLVDAQISNETADGIFPELASEYWRLGAALRKRGPPLDVIVSGSGGIDLRLPVFASRKVLSMVITTPAGAKRLRERHPRQSVDIRVIPPKARAIRPSAILDEVSDRRAVPHPSRRSLPVATLMTKGSASSWGRRLHRGMPPGEL